jgi:RimJ/RimL family protein N-acetyltransferase
MALVRIDSTTSASAIKAFITGIVCVILIGLGWLSDPFDTELNRIQARVATDNFQSQAVCDRAGFRKEGVLRQAEWLHNHYVDLTMNSLLKPEWKK